MTSSRFLSAGLLLLAGCAPKSSPPSSVSPAPSGLLRVSWQMKTAPRSLDVVPVTVGVVDKEGQPVGEASVSADLSMPSMPMPENKVLLREAKKGTYVGSVRFTMSGAWTATVTASQGGRRGMQTFPIAVK